MHGTETDGRITSDRRTITETSYSRVTTGSAYPEGKGSRRRRATVGAPRMTSFGGRRRSPHGMGVRTRDYFVNLHKESESSSDGGDSVEPLSASSGRDEDRAAKPPYNMPETANAGDDDDSHDNFTSLPRGRRVLGYRIDSTGKYPVHVELVDPIGRGACAVVWKAKRIKSDDDPPSTQKLPNTFAVKHLDLRPLRLKPNFDRERSKLRREVSILSKLQHRSIINLFAVVETDSDIFLVMEYIKGGELFRRLVMLQSLTEEQARYVIVQVVDAMQYVHSRGVIHRDLKLENILVAKESKTGYPIVKVADFGLSKFVGFELSTARSFVGTPQYWAPEVIKASRSANASYGPEADLWSLGCLLYVLVGGAYPFDDRMGPIESAILEGQFHFRYPKLINATEEFKDLVLGLLTVNPERRLTLEKVIEHPWMKAPMSPSLPPLANDSQMDDSTHRPYIQAQSLLRGVSEEGNLISSYLEHVKQKSRKPPSPKESRSRSHAGNNDEAAVRHRHSGRSRQIDSMGKRTPREEGRNSPRRHSHPDVGVSTLEGGRGDFVFERQSPSSSTSSDVEEIPRIVPRKGRKGLNLVDFQPVVSAILASHGGRKNVCPPVRDGPGSLRGDDHHPTNGDHPWWLLRPERPLTTHPGVSANPQMFDPFELVRLQLSILKRLHVAFLIFRNDPEMRKRLNTAMRQFKDLTTESGLVIHKFDDTCAVVLDVLPDLKESVLLQYPDFALELLEMLLSWSNDMKRDASMMRDRYLALISTVSEISTKGQAVKQQLDHMNIVRTALATSGHVGAAGPAAAGYLSRMAPPALNDTSTRPVKSLLHKPEEDPRPTEEQQETAGQMMLMGPNYIDEVESVDLSGLGVRRGPEECRPRKLGNSVFFDEERVKTQRDSLLDYVEQFVYEDGEQQDPAMSNRASEIMKTILDFLFLAPHAVRASDYSNDNFIPAHGAHQPLTSDSMESTEAPRTAKEIVQDPMDDVAEQLADTIVTGMCSDFNASWVLLAAIEQLRRVDQILIAMQVFWGNLQQTIERLLKIREYTGRLLKYSARNEIFKTRFVTRIAEYEAFWKDLRLLCSTYCDELHSRIPVVFQELEDVTSAVLSSDTILAAACDENRPDLHRCKKT